MEHKIVGEGLTFDDVLIIPGDIYTDVNAVSTKTKFSKNIELNIPFVTAGMRNVTESLMAIAVARQGGIGIIHNNMSIEEQCSEVDKVKRSEHGVVTDPFYLSPNDYLYKAEELMSKYRISGVPITEHGLLVGIVTNRDLRFEKDYTKKIYEVMTRDNLITAREDITMDEASKILADSKVEKLPLVDGKGYLKGLITTKDIQKSIKYPNSAKDSQGRLLAAARVQVDESYKENVQKLVNVKVDAIVIEESNNLKETLEAIKWIKSNFNCVDVVAGNVVTKKSAEKLIEAGADGIKIGIGAGSTSIARIMSGVGMPQLTALQDVEEVCIKNNVPVLNDGGIKYSGDITKAIAAGADAVILGATIAGTDQAPGEIGMLNGIKFKNYQGLTCNKSIDIGNKQTVVYNDAVDATVLYTGSVIDVINQHLVGLRLGMSQAGVNTIKELKENAKFVKITNNGLKESHNHSINVTRDSIG